MDMQTYPSGVQTVDFNHVKNPKQTKYLNAKMSGYNPPATAPAPGVAPAGVDNTGVYRDPWGNPYVITMDLNFDNKCNDQLYSLQAVSQNPPGSTSQSGFNGLSNTNASGAGNFYQFNGQVMVWSAGPDGQYDLNQAANASFNKDNVVSWQQ